MMGLLALLMVGVGLVWTMQGLGYLASSQSDRAPESLAVLGPLVGGLGVALALVAARRRS